ncbi:hypothetical protein K8R03_03555 [Candidatus Kaiserbacteria bacterium]|nr:hypothetical protein [Candidatus Kaiserbacteria bacterium]
MWNKILAFNSFVVLPATFVFLVYASTRALFFWEWKLFWIAVVLSIAVLVAETVLAILTE